MPRTGKGGKVDGTVGKAYSNRTDLNAATRTVPGQEYGMATQQRQAMKTVPMAKAQPVPSPTVQAPQQVPSPTVQPTQQSAPEPLLFDHPSENNNEPITHGLPIGPGGGPEVLNLRPRPDTFADTLMSLAQDPAASEQLRQMAYLTQQTGF